MTANLTRCAVVVEATVAIKLTECEARALDGIFGYNVDAFLKVFYERMGEAYVKPYEAGVRSLHKTVRGALAKPLSEINKVRNSLTP